MHSVEWMSACCRPESRELGKVLDESRTVRDEEGTPVSRTGSVNYELLAQSQDWKVGDEAYNSNKTQFLRAFYATADRGAIHVIGEAEEDPVVTRRRESRKYLKMVLMRDGRGHDGGFVSRGPQAPARLSNMAEAFQPGWKGEHGAASTAGSSTKGVGLTGAARSVETQGERVVRRAAERRAAKWVETSKTINLSWVEGQMTAAIASEKELAERLHELALSREDIESSRAAAALAVSRPASAAAMLIGGGGGEELPFSPLLEYDLNVSNGPPARLQGTSSAPAGLAGRNLFKPVASQRSLPASPANRPRTAGSPIDTAAAARRPGEVARVVRRRRPSATGLQGSRLSLGVGGGVERFGVASRELHSQRRQRLYVPDDLRVRRFELHGCARMNSLQLRDRQLRDLQLHMLLNIPSHHWAYKLLSTFVAAVGLDAPAEAGPGGLGRPAPERRRPPQRKARRWRDGEPRCEREAGAVAARGAGLVGEGGGGQGHRGQGSLERGPWCRRGRGAVLAPVTSRAEAAECAEVLNTLTFRTNTSAWTRLHNDDKAVTKPRQCLPCAALHTQPAASPSPTAYWIRATC